MADTADVVPSPRAVVGGARVSRGLVTAVLSVGSAAVSHTVAGHQGPHWVVLLLALAIAVPVCSALSSVRLSRARLGGAVMFSQAVFHGLFALFPAAGNLTHAAVHSDAAAHAGHAAHDHGITVTAAAQTSAVADVWPDAPMAFAHLLAGVFTFAVFRRGELLLHALGALLMLTPVLMLFLRPVILTGPRAIRAHDSFSTIILQDLWLGGGAQTLRGPPVLMS